MSIEVFRRTEKKYLLNEQQYSELFKQIEPYLLKDKYHKSTICNIYYDTTNNDLITSSIEKPPYKEKVRLRSYGIPSMDSQVFLEIKKKYNGIVGKRRVDIKLSDFYNYINNNVIPTCNKQIMEEIDYCFKKYKLNPSLFIAYDRLSYYSKENSSLRITIDTNIRNRVEDLNLELGDSGFLYFKDKTYLMEVKVLGSFPLWFVNAMSSLNIYPVSFSKYGKIYEKLIKEERNV